MTLLVVLLPFAAMAQLRVVGLVEDENHQPVIGASVYRVPAKARLLIWMVSS